MKTLTRDLPNDINTNFFEGFSSTIVIGTNNYTTKQLRNWNYNGKGLVSAVYSYNTGIYLNDANPITTMGYLSKVHTNPSASHNFTEGYVFTNRLAKYLKENKDVCQKLGLKTTDLLVQSRSVYNKGLKDNFVIVYKNNSARQSLLVFESNKRTVRLIVTDELHKKYKDELEKILDQIIGLTKYLYSYSAIVAI